MEQKNILEENLCEISYKDDYIKTTITIPDGCTCTDIIEEFFKMLFSATYSPTVIITATESALSKFKEFIHYDQ